MGVGAAGTGAMTQGEGEVTRVAEADINIVGIRGAAACNRRDITACIIKMVWIWERVIAIPP